MSHNCSSCGSSINTPIDEISSPGAVFSGVCGQCNPPTPCNISGVSMSGCGCNVPTCNGCCQNVQRATPEPYYLTAPSCAEDHQKCIVNNNFVTAVKIKNSWGVPICTGAAIISIPGLTNIVIGGYIWHPMFGYFQVIGFDATTGQVTVQNNCTQGNASPGTQVPACSSFIVTPPPFSSSSGGGVPSIYPYLAVDFTAPADGVCIPVTFTTTQGLSVGKNVQIGTGVYELSSITNATNATICNNGSGAVPNTPVLAYDSEGNLQYPVILIDTNPCTNEPVDSGALIVCSGNMQQPLAATSLGQVPVVIDAETGEVEFRTLDVPTRTCSTLTACLTLVAGTTVYVITLANANTFIVGDVLQIGSRTDRFTVTAINDATHLTATRNSSAGPIVNIEAGTSICIADCCEINAIAIEELQDELDAYMTETDAAIAALNPCLDNTAYKRVNDTVFGPDTTPTSLADGETATGPTNDITILNTSTCRYMIAMVTIDRSWTGTVAGGASGESSYQTYRLLSGEAQGPIGGVPLPALVINDTYNKSTGALLGSPFYVAHQDSRSRSLQIPPLTEARVSAACRITHHTSDSNTFEVLELQARMTYFALAI